MQMRTMEDLVNTEFAPLAQHLIYHPLWKVSQGQIRIDLPTAHLMNSPTQFHKDLIKGIIILITIATELTDIAR